MAALIPVYANPDAVAASSSAHSAKHKELLWTAYSEILGPLYDFATMEDAEAALDFLGGFRCVSYLQ